MGGIGKQPHHDDKGHNFYLIYARGLRNAALFVEEELVLPLKGVLIAALVVRPVGDRGLGEKPDAAVELVVTPTLAVAFAFIAPAEAFVPEAAFDDTILEAAALVAIDDIMVADMGLPIIPPAGPTDPGDAATCAAAKAPPETPGPAMALLSTNLSPYSCSYSLTATSIDLFSSESSFSKADLLASSSVLSEVVEAAAKLCSLWSISCFRVDICNQPHQSRLR